jgi:hypothetical protein
MVEQTTQPADPFQALSPVPVESSVEERDLFVWFEDTSSRPCDGFSGIAGLPECLLPADPELHIIESSYALGHLHLLAAVRLKSRRNTSDHIAAIYTAALAVGTVAWIGTGSQYAQAWDGLYGHAPSSLND